jgi:SAM-dependent methyltransferase
MTQEQTIKNAVRDRYGSKARNSDSASCCGPSNIDDLLSHGYSREEVGQLPESAIVMAAGCGNPTALGMIRTGETVLDLGSGGGVDVLLASKRVGIQGKVIGLDMTKEMVQRASDNAQKLGLRNVEFKQGEIENIPLEDESVDVIMSNCVICLSPDKERVFQQMFRVLRRRGRLAIADEVALKPFSKEEKADVDKWCSCSSGAITGLEYVRGLEDVGFTDILVKPLEQGDGYSGTGVIRAFVTATKS